MSDTDGASAPKNLDEAHALVKRAMEDVKQELCIIDKQGKMHLVYIFDFHIHGGKLHVDYKALEESDEINALVHEAMQAQINQIMKDKEEQKWSKRFWRTCCTTIRTLFQRIRT